MHVWQLETDKRQTASLKSFHEEVRSSFWSEEIVLSWPLGKTKDVVFIFDG